MMAFVAPNAGRGLPNGLAYAFPVELASRRAMPGRALPQWRAGGEGAAAGWGHFVRRVPFPGGHHGLDERDVVLAPRDVRIIYMMVAAPNALTREARELLATAKEGAR